MQRSRHTSHAIQALAARELHDYNSGFAGISHW
jgi:hypothetical protein